jgi:hypothetical protein
VVGPAGPHRPRRVQDATPLARPGLAELGTDPGRDAAHAARGGPARLRLGSDADQAALEAADRQWTRLSYLTELVAHSWATADPPSRPTGERAWSVVADVVAVTEAAAVLDRQLPQHHPGRNKGSVAAGVGRGHYRRAFRRAAEGGPLPRSRPLRGAPHRFQPIPVTLLASLLGALRNLAGMVAGAAHLRPRTVAPLVGAHTAVLEMRATAVTRHLHNGLLSAARGRPTGPRWLLIQSADRDQAAAVGRGEDLRAGCRRHGKQMPPIVQLLEKASKQAAWKDPQGAAVGVG